MARLVYGVHPVARRCAPGKVQALFVARGRRRPGAARDLDAARQGQRAAGAARPRPRSTRWRNGGVHQGVVAVTGEYTTRSSTRSSRLARKRRAPAAGAGARQRAGPAEPGRAGAHRARRRRARHRHPEGSRGRRHAGGGQGLGGRHRAHADRDGGQHRARARGAQGGRACGSPARWPKAASRRGRSTSTGRCALVLGAEGKGIRPLVLRGCDLLVRIPMAGKVASLNVGAAGAMLLYEAARQRSQPKPKPGSV